MFYQYYIKNNVQFITELFSFKGSSEMAFTKLDCYHNIVMKNNLICNRLT